MMKLLARCLHYNFYFIKSL
jgi:hypothetical protein